MDFHTPAQTGTPPTEDARLAGSIVQFQNAYCDLTQPAVDVRAGVSQTQSVSASFLVTAGVSQTQNLAATPFFLAPLTQTQTVSCTLGNITTYPNGYSQRRPVVLPAFASGTTLNFPLPIKQPSILALAYGARVAASDGTSLSTDAANSSAVYGLIPSWARGTRTKLYVYHDKPSPAETSTAALVWAAHAAMVRCGATATDISGRRSTTTGGVPVDTTISGWPAGLYDGVDDESRLIGISAWAGSTALTISFLLQANAANPTGNILGTGNDLTSSTAARCNIRCIAGKILARIETNAGILSVTTSAAVITDTAAHHVAIVWSATKRPIIYVDGEAKATVDTNITGLAGVSVPLTGNVWIGTGVDPASNGRFAGKIGEVAISTSARDALWIATLSDAYLHPSRLFGIGADDLPSDTASPVAVPSRGATKKNTNVDITPDVENPGSVTYTLALGTSDSPANGSFTLTSTNPKKIRWSPTTDYEGAGYASFTITAGTKSSTASCYGYMPTGWWNVVGLRKTLTYRRFRAGPDMWGGSAAQFEAQTTAPPEMVSAQTCPDPTGSNRHNWVHVCGGPIHKESDDDLNDLSDHQTGQPYQGFLTTGSIASSYTSIKNARAGDEDKLFWIPMLYAQPNATALNYTETISGDERSKIDIWNLINSNGTVPGTSFTTDDVYWTLGRRCGLAATAKGVSKDKLVIRWNKEGNRACPWGAPFNLDQETRFAAFVGAWKRILAAFDRGYGQPAVHYYGYARSGNTGTLCAPGGDPTLINRDGIWSAMECSWHPAKEVTQGGANAKINGETTAQLKARVKARYDEIIAGIGQGFAYQTFIDYCGNNRIPFIVSESDPSKTTGSPCWVPDWAMEWLLDTYNTWSDALEAKGTCLITGMFDTANYSPNWFWDNGEQTTMKNAGATSLGLPQWYPGYTTTKPIPDANWALIKAEFQSRHATAVATFKSKWGS